MKVLLVKPLSDMHVILLPIGLGYLASYCQKQNPNLELKILDCHRERFTEEKFKEYIRNFKPDVIGFTALSMEINSARAFAFYAKQVKSEIVTIIGGPHVSALPRTVLADRNVDYVFRGEAEVGFSYFIKHFSSNERLNSPGLGYLKGEDLIFNDSSVIDELDDIPFPDYQKMQFEKYPKMYFMKRFPSAPILSSRGCPFTCTFCAGHMVSGRKWRSRSVDNILMEIEYLSRKYNIREINFWDDNFTFDRSRTEEFCGRFKKLNKHIIWWCPNGVRLETLDKSILVKMKQSGCYSVAFGVESGSEKIQQDMKKRISFKKLKEMSEFSHSIGLRTQGFFILGYPTEKEEDILATIKLARTLPFLRASFSLFQPIAGSEIYQCLVDQKLINEEDAVINACDYSKANVPTYYIKDLAKIKRLQRKAILGFYFRPKIFLRVLLENLSLPQIKELIKIVKYYILER
ncbi:MAG: radical SAM protein [Candidatus Omnitrophota bacterium]